MSRILLFAMHHAQAKHFIDKVEPQRRRDYVILTGPHSEHRAHGVRAETAIFLDDWFRGWPPMDAHRTFGLVNVYGVENVWEQRDILRQQRAREEIGLAGSFESEFVMFHLPSIEHDWDGWLFTDTSRRWHTLLERNKTLNPLPGLDDKKGSHNPVGGVVFKNLFDIEDPDGAYPLYADWFIRRNIRTPDIYIKEPKRDRDNISAALDWFRLGLADDGGVLASSN